MDQALTNKKFIEQIDDVIETLGGTPVDLELTEDREDDMVSNGVFVDKMDEVIEALGGTPSEIIVGDDEADDMVSDNIFQLKMEDVVKNMSGGGGGGGGGGDILIPTITLTSDTTYTLDTEYDVCISLVQNSSFIGLNDGENVWTTWPIYDSGTHGFGKLMVITLPDYPDEGNMLLLDGYLLLFRDGTMTEYN